VTADRDRDVARRWAEQLAGWAIPDELRATVVADPHRFDVARFVRAAEAAEAAGPADRPSLRRSLAAVPAGGSVLDVGCGAGAASLPLVPPAASVIGVDTQPDMLTAFAARARARGAAVTTVAGRWPDVAGGVGDADVVVCHHVVYNVGDLVPFVVALTDHARYRVVVELSQRHPLAWLAPYWRALHELDRPDGPTSQDAVAVLRAAGLRPEVEHWDAPSQHPDEHPAERLAALRERLCVGAERDAELADALAAFPPPTVRPTTTLWWDVD
jgi:2-polyprenyl-3-methyl-5-hydroxy-6-metoxy-1,4-benzoquinol methylase